MTVCEICFLNTIRRILNKYLERMNEAVTGCEKSVLVGLGHLNWSLNGHIHGIEMSILFIFRSCNYNLGYRYTRPIIIIV